MTLNMGFAPMALSATTFNAGDKVRVTVDFKYTVEADATVHLYAAPYYTNILGKHLVDSCVGRSDVTLPATATPLDKTATVDFTLVPKAQSGIEDGTYGLAVWVRTSVSTSDPWSIPRPPAVDNQDSVLLVSGNSSGGIGDTLTSIMPMLMMVMMMGMIMPMMQGMGGGTEE
jgi:hypothetical protein